MTTQNKPSEERSQESVLGTANLVKATISFSSPTMAYHELDPVPVREVDALEQLQNQLETLQDLQSRMGFMMREIRYLMKV